MTIHASCSYVRVQNTEPAGLQPDCIPERLVLMPHDVRQQNCTLEALMANTLSISLQIACSIDHFEFSNVQQLTFDHCLTKNDLYTISMTWTGMPGPAVWQLLYQTSYAADFAEL